MAYLRSQGEIGRASLVHVGKASARLVITWVGSELDRPVITMLLALTATNALIVVLTLRSRILPASSRGERLRMPRAYWSSSLRRAWALAFTVLLAWASVAGNRFVVLHLLGLDSLATYAANYSVLSIPSFVPMILTFTLLHELSVALQRGDMASARGLIDESVGAYLFLTLPILVLLVLFYRPIVDVLAPGYGVGPVLHVSLIGFFFMFGLEQVLVFATFAGAGGGGALGARLVSVVVNVGAAYLMVSAGGLQYAAVSLCLGSTVVVGMCWGRIRKRAGSSGSWNVYGHIVFSALCMAAVGGALIAVGPPLPMSQVIVASLTLGILYCGLESVHRQSFTRLLTRDSIGQLRILWRRGTRRSKITE
jgi:O-antigen/teichoic acid export membrane protein